MVFSNDFNDTPGLHPFNLREVHYSIRYRSALIVMTMHY